MTTPILPSQQTRFKSASEVTTMRKRTVVNNYYGNYPQDQKRAYASTYTTFQAGAVANDIGESVVSSIPTCTTNSRGFVLSSNKTVVPTGEKATPNMYVSSRAYINNPQ
uniref:Uncharacterized protein n=1 Tax=viral metagenome TaxID=1070528 RepID=A0A6C0B6Q8_9ZZZZ